MSAGGDKAWGQQWDSSSSRRGRSYQWSVPTSKDLTGSDYDTDREWRRSRVSYSRGWANDPSCPTHTEPEDDRQTDPALPSGSTSKTWDPCGDRNSWSKKSSNEDPATCASSMSSTQWRPKLRQIGTCRALLATPLKEARQHRGWSALMSL